ncbi:nodulation-signaling pathway 2 protein-like [Olea europaea var. sylvestris]|uniref:nodulation-signaling pathway 2 protein-like n=1 Tax=Olea europaea var. sylvestris TaxID=158386 RepID=UPI000C1D0072|nr:nodulation-signaling pathway 2 protein-like [Olea europaea var. sylvestris]
MEYEIIHYDLEPSYIDQTNPYSIQDKVSNDIERFLQLETDFMDLDFIEEDAVLGLDENIQETTLLAAAACEEILHNVETQEDGLEGCGLTDLLLLGAEAIEAENWIFASSVVTKLNNLLSDEENGDNPIGRLALYFTEGLIYKSLDFPELQEETFGGKSNHNTFSAFQMLQELSPYVKFAHFTANQAILEATRGHKEVHVIDFDIMEGIQWPSLMVDLAGTEDASLRITAVVTDHKNLGNIQQMRLRLQDFANSINLPFNFDHVFMTTEKDFEEIKVENSTVIANCMLHQLHMPYKDSAMVKTFLKGVRKLCPKIVILVEEELFNLDKVSSMSYVEFFREALHHYAAVSDSLQSGFHGGFKLAVKIIERKFLRTRILDSVKQFPCEQRERQLWKNEYPSMEGFRPIPLSSWNVSQAKFLVSLFSGSYWVQNERCRLALCWKSRPLTTASIWVPKSIENQRKDQFLFNK